MRRSRSSPAATSGPCRPPAAKRRLLVSHPANESRPLYSPDGRQARVRLEPHRRRRHLRPHLRDRRPDAPDLRRWGRAARRLVARRRWIYFSSTSRDIAGMNDVFRVSADGGTPMEVTADRYTNEYFSSAAPDGSTAGHHRARDAPRASGGATATVISTKRRSGSCATATTRRSTRRSPPAAPRRCGRCGRPTASRSTTSPIAAARRTSGSQADRRDRTAPRPADDVQERARALAVDLRRRRGDRLRARLRHLDARHRQRTRPRASPITRRGAPAGHRRRASDAHRRLLRAGALAGRQEGGVRRARRGVRRVGQGRRRRGARQPHARERVAASPGRPTAARWSTRRIAKAARHLFLYDFATASETRLTSGADGDHSPRFSPDGKSLAFVRGDSELRVLDLASKQERLLARGVFDRPPFAATPPFAWSPDNRWLAYLSTRHRRASPTCTSSPPTARRSRPISFLANAFANTISWSPDGKAVLFDTGQRTEAAAARAHRPDAAHAAVPRGSVPRSVQREEPVRPAPPPNPPKDAPRRRRARAGRCARGREAAGKNVRDRVRRHPPAPVAAADRRRRRRRSASARTARRCC